MATTRPTSPEILGKLDPAVRFLFENNGPFFIVSSDDEQDAVLIAHFNAAVQSGALTAETLDKIFNDVPWKLCVRSDSTSWLYNTSKTNPLKKKTMLLHQLVLDAKQLDRTLDTLALSKAGAARSAWVTQKKQEAYVELNPKLIAYLRTATNDNIFTTPIAERVDALSALLPAAEADEIVIIIETPEELAGKIKLATLSLRELADNFAEEPPTGDKKKTQATKDRLLAAIDKARGVLALEPAAARVITERVLYDALADALAALDLATIAIEKAEKEEHARAKALKSKLLDHITFAKLMIMTAENPDTTLTQIMQDSAREQLTAMQATIAAVEALRKEAGETKATTFLAKKSAHLARLLAEPVAISRKKLAFASDDFQDSLNTKIYLRLQAFERAIGKKTADQQPAITHPIDCAAICDALDEEVQQVALAWGKSHDPDTRIQRYQKAVLEAAPAQLEQSIQENTQQVETAITDALTSLDQHLGAATAFSHLLRDIPFLAKEIEVIEWKVYYLDETVEANNFSGALAAKQDLGSAIPDSLHAAKLLQATAKQLEDYLQKQSPSAELTAKLAELKKQKKRLDETIIPRLTNMGQQLDELTQHLTAVVAAQEKKPTQPKVTPLQAETTPNTLVNISFNKIYLQPQYRVRNDLTHRSVFIKRKNEPLFADPDQLQRLQQELLALAKQARPDLAANTDAAILDNYLKLPAGALAYAIIKRKGWVEVAKAALTPEQLTQKQLEFSLFLEQVQRELEETLRKTRDNRERTHISQLQQLVRDTIKLNGDYASQYLVQYGKAIVVPHAEADKTIQGLLEDAQAALRNSVKVTSTASN